MRRRGSNQSQMNEASLLAEIPGDQRSFPIKPGKLPIPGSPGIPGTFGFPLICIPGIRGTPGIRGATWTTWPTIPPRGFDPLAACPRRQPADVDVLIPMRLNVRTPKIIPVKRRIDWTFLGDACGCFTVLGDFSPPDFITRGDPSI